MKKMIFILLLLAGIIAKAQHIPQYLKDSALKGYIEIRGNIANLTYNSDKDPYYPWMKKCLAYCKSAKDSIAYSNWIVTKYNAYKKEHKL